MVSNTQRPYDWRSVAIFSLTLFLLGLTSPRPNLGSGLTRFAMGIVAGIVLAVFGGLIVGVWKYFKRSEISTTNPSPDAIRARDRSLFIVAMVLAAFLIGKAFYLESYGALVDAAMLIALGFAVKAGVGFARWVFAIYAFVTPLIVVASGGGGAYIWPFVFYYAISSAIAHMSTTRRQNRSADRPQNGQACDDGQLNSVDGSTEASVVDDVYAKIDHELETNNLHRPTWTRAQGDAEGDVERAKALYIKYRAQRLLVARRDESAHQSIVDGPGVEIPPKKYNSRFLAATGGILVCAVVAVIVIGFFTEKPAPTKGATSGSNLDLASFADMDPVEKKPVKGNPVDQFDHPEKPGESTLDMYLKGGSDTERAARYGITLQEFQRRAARAKALCITSSFEDFDCLGEVHAGLR